jgi:hypothetical protein
MKKKDQIANLYNYREELKQSQEDETGLIIQVGEKLEMLREELTQDRKRSRHNRKQ